MTLTLTYDLDLQSSVSYGHANVQGQRSVGSEDRVDTNERPYGQTDRGNCITFFANVIDKYQLLTFASDETDARRPMSKYSKYVIHECEKVVSVDQDRCCNSRASLVHFVYNSGHVMGCHVTLRRDLSRDARRRK